MLFTADTYKGRKGFGFKKSCQPNRYWSSACVIMRRSVLDCSHVLYRFLKKKKNTLSASHPFVCTLIVQFLSSMTIWPLLFPHETKQNKVQKTFCPKCIAWYVTCLCLIQNSCGTERYRERENNQTLGPMLFGEEWLFKPHRFINIRWKYRDAPRPQLSSWAEMRFLYRQLKIKTGRVPGSV